MRSGVERAAAVARLRPKNQLTLPEAILSEVGAKVGDRFRITAEDGVVRLHPVRSSYYGALKDLWPPDWMEELRRDRDSWQP